MRVAVLLLAASADARECGQEEINARDITGCSTVLHMKNLGHQGAIWLGDALHHNPHLEFLDLHHTFIGDDDAQAIAYGLHNNSYLKRIALHNNRIFDAGAKALGDALAHNDALEFLSLSSNGVGDKGAAALAEGLKANSRLRRLDLYFNLVSDDGAVAFAQAIEANRGLRTLHLDTNTVGDVGGLALCQAVAPRKRGWLGGGSGDGAPPRFGELTLMYNQLTNAAAATCIDAARDNALVHTLSLEHNHAVDGAVAARMADEHEPRMAERRAVATWIVEHDLVTDGWHSADGPPLASVYAQPVGALRVHTRDGLLALQADDADALAARPELRTLADHERTQLVHAIQRALAAALAPPVHDEL